MGGLDLGKGSPRYSSVLGLGPQMPLNRAGHSPSVAYFIEFFRDLKEANYPCTHGLVWQAGTLKGR